MLQPDLIFVNQSASVKKQLRKAWEEKSREEAKQVTVINEETEKPLNLTELVSEASGIQTVRKENVFSSEVTEEERNIINQRVAQQQKLAHEFEKKRKGR